MTEMITEGIYTTDMTGIDHDQALEQFAMGDAAMFCSGLGIWMRLWRRILICRSI